jgi:hypothetical protein
MGYIIYIPEIIRNLSTGANPVCPKPVGRAVANHMGKSERIAEKYMASEYTGRVNEPRNTILSCGQPMFYGLSRRQQHHGQTTVIHDEPPGSKRMACI